MIEDMLYNRGLYYTKVIFYFDPLVRGIYSESVTNIST